MPRPNAGRSVWNGGASPSISEGAQGFRQAGEYICLLPLFPNECGSSCAWRRYPKSEEKVLPEDAENRLQAPPLGGIFGNLVRGFVVELDAFSHGTRVCILRSPDHSCRLEGLHGTLVVVFHRLLLSIMGFVDIAGCSGAAEPPAIPGRRQKAW